MLNQKLSLVFEAPEPPVAVADNPHSFPGDFSPAAGLDALAKAYSAGAIKLLAAEYTACHLLTLPKAPARQRAAMIRFAAEDKIAVPLETVVVSQGPVSPSSPGQTLAFVTAKSVLDAHREVVNLIPEFLMIPAPKTDATWAVWHEGHRVVVRTSDGTGFAALLSDLSMLWHRAARPAIVTLAAPLPAEFNARDLSDQPITPDKTDLAFRFAQDKNRDTASALRTLGFAASAVGLAASVHLGLMALDVIALRQEAARTEIVAQRAIADLLPGVTITPDVQPILARLQPKPASTSGGPFLPMITAVTAAITATPLTSDTPVSFRRLTWGADGNELVLLLQAGGLEDLQSVQQTLEANGFVATAGAANATNGGAEVEMRITRGGSGQ